MIRCNKCSNTKHFVEIHVGGYRKHEWKQEDNGRFTFCKSTYDKVDDTYFECLKCGASVDDQYRQFLRALFENYNENKHGA